MLKLADNSDDDGRNARPSQKRIARETGLSVPTVVRVLKEKIGDGTLEIERVHNKQKHLATCYRINLQLIDDLLAAQNQDPRIEFFQSNGRAPSTRREASIQPDMRLPSQLREPPLSVITHPSDTSPSTSSETSLTLTKTREPLLRTDGDDNIGKHSSRNGGGLLGVLDIDADRIRRADRDALKYLVRAFEMEKPPREAMGFAAWLDSKLKFCAGEGFRYPKIVLARLKQIQRGEFIVH